MVQTRDKVQTSTNYLNSKIFRMIFFLCLFTFPRKYFLSTLLLNISSDGRVRVLSSCSGSGLTRKLKILFKFGFNLKHHSRYLPKLLVRPIFIITTKTIRKPYKRSNYFSLAPYNVVITLSCDKLIYTILNITQNCNCVIYKYVYTFPFLTAVTCISVVIRNVLIIVNSRTFR